MSGTERKPRSDAQRNRERLIAAAKEVLSRGGPEASLEGVARRAGVGIGTLYRHFPTREDLFQAVYRQDVEGLVALAASMDARNDAVAALRDWVHANVAVVATKRGILGTMSVVPGDDPGRKAVYGELSQMLNAAVDTLVRRAIAQGALRPDTTAADVLQTTYAFCYARPPELGWEAHVLRLLDIFLDGLRTRPGSRATS